MFTHPCIDYGWSWTRQATCKVQYGSWMKIGTFNRCCKVTYEGEELVSELVPNLTSWLGIAGACLYWASVNNVVMKIIHQTSDVSPHPWLCRGEFDTPGLDQFVKTCFLEDGKQNWRGKRKLVCQFLFSHKIEVEWEVLMGLLLSFRDTELFLRMWSVDMYLDG